ASPGQSGDDHNGQGKQEPGEDNEHNMSASPGASCAPDADDTMGATPRPSTSEHESDDSRVGATPRPSSSEHEADDAMVHATLSPKPSMSGDSDRDDGCESGSGHDD